MKKLLFTVLFLMCWTLASAQVDFSKLRIGVRAGVGIGTVDATFEDQDNTESMSGGQFILGATAELPVWKFLRVTAEVDFEHTGVSDESKTMYMTGTTAYDATIFTTTRTKYPLSYIHIPIMARACFVKDIIYVEAGPQFGILVGKVKTHAESTITTMPNGIGASQTEKQTDDYDAADNFKKSHVALALGWGANFGRKRQFSAGIRLGIGLNDIQAPDHKLDGCRVSHTDIQASIRYWF